MPYVVRTTEAQRNVLRAIIDGRRVVNAGDRWIVSDETYQPGACHRWETIYRTVIMALLHRGLITVDAGVVTITDAGRHHMQAFDRLPETQ